MVKGGYDVVTESK